MTQIQSWEWKIDFSSSSQQKQIPNQVKLNSFCCLILLAYENISQQTWQPLDLLKLGQHWTMKKTKSSRISHVNFANLCREQIEKFWITSAQRSTLLVSEQCKQSGFILRQTEYVLQWQMCYGELSQSKNASERSNNFFFRCFQVFMPKQFTCSPFKSFKADQIQINLSRCVWGHKSNRVKAKLVRANISGRFGNFKGNWNWNLLQGNSKKASEELEGLVRISKMISLTTSIHKIQTSLQGFFAVQVFNLIKFPRERLRFPFFCMRKAKRKLWT